MRFIIKCKDGLTSAAQKNAIIPATVYNCQGVHLKYQIINCFVEAYKYKVNGVQVDWNVGQCVLILIYQCKMVNNL